MRRGQLVKFYPLLIAALLLAPATSCNSSSDLITAGMYFDVPGRMSGGRNAQWRLNMPNLVAPLAVEWDFGGGADPNRLSTSTDFDSSVVEVRMLNEVTTGASRYRLRVFVTDGLGDKWNAEVEYFVGPPQIEPVFDSPPSYDSTTRALTVRASDANGDALTVSVEVDPSLIADRNSVNIPGSGGEAVFFFSASAPEVGGSGTVRVSVDDGFGNSVHAEVEVSVPAETIELLAQ